MLALCSSLLGMVLDGLVGLREALRIIIGFNYHLIERSAPVCKHGDGRALTLALTLALA